MITLTSSLLRSSSSSLCVLNRHLHGSISLLMTVASPQSSFGSVEKSALAKLRKTTGYSFTRCKEALEKHNNDLKQAEVWLRNEAQTHGWQKATKLQGRSTAQGLISVLASQNNAVILELNCETDFVARNKKFQSLLQRVTHACYDFKGQGESSQNFSKITLEQGSLLEVPISDARLTKDEIALSIGEIGENIQAKRALIMKSSGEVMLAGYTHPASPDANKPIVQSGKFGAIVAFSVKEGGKDARKSLGIKEIGRQLCQHIVGMNPLEIGSMDEPPKKAKVVDKLPTPTSTSQIPTEPDEIVDETTFIKSKDGDIDETVLLNQEFLLDPELTVRDFLIQNSVRVVDFVRFECGEDLEKH